MKNFLLTIGVAVVCVAGAKADLLSDPSVVSQVSADRGVRLCHPDPVPSETRPANAVMKFSGEAYHPEAIPQSVAIPEIRVYRGVRQKAPDLTSLPGAKIGWLSKSSDHTVSVFNTTIALKEGSTYTATPFVFSDVSLEFDVDPSTGNVTIPVQKVADLDDNIISICKVNIQNGSFSPTDNISGCVVDGAVYIEDAFGFFVTDGPLYGQYLNVGIMKHAVLGASNATFRNNAISFANNSMTQANRRVTTSTTQAFAYNVGADRLRVLYVPLTSGTYGEFTATLTPTGTVEINPQPAYVYSILGEFYYYGLTENVASDGAITFSASMLSPIRTSYDAAGKRVALPCWGIARAAGGLLSYNESSVITLSKALSFPSAPALSLSGSGTEADPWLIKTASDFVALGSEAANNVSLRSAAEAIPGTNGETCTPVYKGKYFRIANDIDFSSLNVSYTPIGTKAVPFGGILDGNGCTLSNFTIEDYAYDYCGLFGVLSKDSEVKNLKFSNASVTTIGYTAGTLAGRSFGKVNDVRVADSYITARAGYNVGGIVGYGYEMSGCEVSGTRIVALGYMGGIAGRNYGPMTDCAVQATITQTGKQVFAGGVIGHQSKYTTSDPDHHVSGCSFTGTVSCATDEIGIGGIAGAFSYAVMEKCYANAVVLGASSVSCYMGALAGNTYAATITDCYASGFVRNDASRYAGGLIGHVTTSTGGEDNTVMTNCYSSVMLSTASTDPIRGLIGDNARIKITNSYYDAQIAAVPNDDYGLSTARLASSAGLEGFSSDIWSFADGTYPRLKGSETSNIADVATATLLLPAGETVLAVEENFSYSTANDVKWTALVGGRQSETGGYAFTFADGVGQLNYEQQTDTIFVTKGAASKYYLVNIAPVLFDGDGTAENPWKISTKADLIKLSEMSVNASLTFEGKHILQTADIDLEGTRISPICKDAAAKLQFLGTYDGGGHVIDNMKIQSVGFYTADDVPATAVVGQVNVKSPDCHNYAGLFGNIGAAGVVRNVVLGSGCQFDFFQYGGGIAGNVFGVVENCVNLAPVRCYYSYAGGIAGYLQKGGRISDCYNAGGIDVNFSTGGGIVGIAASATIERCENTGAVRGYMFNPYQKDGVQKTVGGIAGKATSCVIRNVANSGEISAFTEVGGILGGSAGTAAEVQTVSDALNYGFTFALTSVTSLGSIAGTNTYTVYENCYTDSRLQRIGLVANGSMEGVTALPTEKIAGNTALFPADTWTVKENSYPFITRASVPAQVALNSSAIVRWSGNDYAQAVTGGATLSSGQTWSVEPSSAFALTGSALTVTVPAESVANAVLTASAGELVRHFPLKSFDYLVFDGDGSAESPFIIATADDFLKLSSTVNSSGFNYAGYTFSQTADLDFSDKTFVPVGSGGSSFGGIYKGNGHSVKNVNFDNPTTDKTVTSGALFGIVDYTGEISGMVIDGTSKFSTYSNAGGISAWLYGKIVNCVNHAPITTYGTATAGSMAAYAYPGAVISGCSNYGAITTKTNYAGGILGQAAALSGVTVDSCLNAGTVKGVTKIGGIVASGSVNVSGCVNSGAVTATTTYAGGVAGEALAPSRFYGCSNTGEVTSPQYLGGVLAFAAAHTEAKPLVMTDCSNSADIQAGAKGYAGGVGGSLCNYAVYTGCTNTGNLVGTSATTCMRLAGVVGTAGTYSTFRNCWNTGDVTAYSNSGGIVGYGSANSALYDCWNTGDITGNSTAACNVGGLVGNGYISMYRCMNSGDVTTLGNYAGGLNGANTGSVNEYNECVNTGHISGINYIGGLVGGGRGHFLNNVNYGTVEGQTGVGGLLGYPGNSAAASFTIYIDSCLSLGKVVSSSANYAVITGENTGCKYLQVGVNYFNTDQNTATAIDAKLSPKAVGMSTPELIGLRLNDAFENLPGCYPMLISMDTVPLYAYLSAQILLREGDSMDHVTRSFTIGNPGGFQWTSSANLTIEGSEVILPSLSSPEEESRQQEAWVRKSLGDLSELYELVVYPSYVGVEETLADGDVVSVTYYTPDGRIVSSPEPGQIVVRRVIYSGGKSVVSKIVSR